MNYKLLSISMLVSCCAGAIFFAIQREWLIIRFLPQKVSLSENKMKNTVCMRRKMQLFFWHQNEWRSESSEILIAQDKDITIMNLLTNWLNLLADEKITTKHIALQSVLLSESGHEAYLSFDRNPLKKEDSTINKWMWIEGLLKTLRENDIKIQGVHFLVHHKPLNDYNLDFSNAWPITGFIKK